MSKSEMNIKQLTLLKTIKNHTFIYQKGPTAKELIQKKRRFSTPFLKIDTLRMYLLRKKRKNLLHREKNSRSFRYKLTRQGLKQIRYLKHKAEELEKQIKMQNQTNNLINQFLLAKAIKKKEQEETKEVIDLVKTIVALRDQWNQLI